MQSQNLSELEAELQSLKAREWEVKRLIREIKEGPKERFHPDMSKITRGMVVALMRKHDAFGFTRDVLASMGVPWPPPKGWKTRIVIEGKRFYGLDNTEPRKQTA